MGVFYCMTELFFKHFGSVKNRKPDQGNPRNNSAEGEVRINWLNPHQRGTNAWSKESFWHTCFSSTGMR